MAKTTRIQKLEDQMSELAALLEAMADEILLRKTEYESIAAALAKVEVAFNLMGKELYRHGEIIERLQEAQPVRPSGLVVPSVR
jgi:hypothetical protein